MLRATRGTVHCTLRENILSSSGWCQRGGPLSQSGAKPLFEGLSDHDRLVSLRVPGPIQERHWPCARHGDQLRKDLLLFRALEFGAIAAAELLPTIGTMAEPSPELVRRPDLAQPEDVAQFGLRDSSRPHAVHKHRAPGDLLTFVNALRSDHRRHRRIQVGFGGCCRPQVWPNRLAGRRSDLPHTAAPAPAARTRSWRTTAFMPRGRWRPWPWRAPHRDSGGPQRSARASISGR